MNYNDVKRFGLHKILPKKKQYGSEHDVQTVRKAIFANKDFVQFAMCDKNAKSIGNIIDWLIRYVIASNDYYYNHEMLDENSVLQIEFIKDMQYYRNCYIRKGEVFDVVKYNSRYIYIMVNKCTLRLSRKADAEYFKEVR